MCCQTSFCVCFFSLLLLLLLLPYNKFIDYKQTKNRGGQKTFANKCPWLRRTQWKTTPLATKSWPVASDPDALHLFFQLAARLHRHQLLQQTEIIRREYLPIPQRTIHLAGFKHLLITISCHNQNVQNAPLLPHQSSCGSYILAKGLIVTMNCTCNNFVPPPPPPSQHSCWHGGGQTLIYCHQL